MVNPSFREKQRNFVLHQKLSTKKTSEDAAHHHWDVSVCVPNTAQPTKTMKLSFFKVYPMYAVSCNSTVNEGEQEHKYTVTLLNNWFTGSLSGSHTAPVQQSVWQLQCSRALLKNNANQERHRHPRKAARLEETQGKEHPVAVAVKLPSSNYVVSFGPLHLNKYMGSKHGAIVHRVASMEDKSPRQGCQRKAQHKTVNTWILTDTPQVI